MSNVRALIAAPSPSIQVLRIRDAGWHIGVVTAGVWDNGHYRANRDELLRLSGFTFFGLVRELQAVIAYKLGRDDRGWFRGRVSVVVDDDRYEPWFGKLDEKRESEFNSFRWRDPAEYKRSQTEVLVPLTLTDVREAMHLAIRPNIETSGPLGYYNIQATMSEHGFTIYQDDVHVATTLQNVLPSYNIPVYWDSPHIAAIISADNPLGTFDP